MIFKAIFAQVRAPWAKIVEKCEKVLITVKVIDMVLIGGPESLLSLFQSIVQKLWIDCEYPQSLNPYVISPLFTLLLQILSVINKD